MKDFLEFIISKIISGGNFQVEERIEERETRYIIKADDDLKPRLIGKGGRTIKSIYNLMNIIAKREGKFIKLDIED